MIPAGTDGQRYCARGDWCAASTRDTEGAWTPALTWQPYCETCTSRIVNCLTGFPPLYGLLASGGTGPARAAGKVRIPAGPRILISPAAEALAGEASAVLAGWAARVRAVPGLQLASPRHPFRSPARVREDCLDLARHRNALLALDAGWTTRVYGRPEAGRWLNRAAGTCRKCRRKVTRSPVSGWWWAHDGLPAGFCDHDPGPVAPAVPPSPAAPGDLAEDIGEEVICEGDGWVKVMRFYGAVQAGAEILELHWHASRLTGQVPAAPDVLDGMPCRSCEAMSSLVRLEQPPPDPVKPPPAAYRCGDCGDEMTRAELTGWAAQYAAWTAGAGILTCRRCDLDLHPECCWPGCTCCRGSRRRAA